VMSHHVRTRSNRLLGRARPVRGVEGRCDAARRDFRWRGTYAVQARTSVLPAAPRGGAGAEKRSSRTLQSGGIGPKNLDTSKGPA